MPQPFEVTTTSPATVAEVQFAFSSESYWQARLFTFGGDSIHLDSLSVDDAGIEVQTTQDLGRDMLPGVMAKALPRGLKVMRRERWRPEGGSLACDAVITATGAPLSATGTALVSPIASGSMLRFSGTLHVRLPLVGGAIERHIVDQLGVEIPAAQRFTTEWIAANG